MPGDPGCLVLITSRKRLKGLDDARSLSLDLLPPADATALLRAIAGPGRIAADGPAPAHAPEQHTPDTARAWLRTEHPNLDAAFIHAHVHALDEHTIALATGLAEILRSDGPWTRALEIHQTAADTAERQDQPVAHGDALTDLGRVRDLAGDVAAADALERALEIYRGIGNRLGEANALNDLGRVHTLTGDYPAAADAQERTLEIFRQLGNRHGEATTLNRRLGPLGRDRSCVVALRNLRRGHSAVADDQFVRARQELDAPRGRRGHGRRRR